LETLSGFPSQSTSPPPFRVPITTCLSAPVGHAIVVHNAGERAQKAMPAETRR